MGKKSKRQRARNIEAARPPADARAGDPPLSEREAPRKSDETPPRRTFLASAAKLSAGLCGAAFTAGAVRFAIPNVDAGIPDFFPIGSLSDFKVNTLTWLCRHNVFVVRDETGIGVFSSRCTHLGCMVQRTKDGFECPCHGAAFDAEGRVRFGPARTDLPWYGTTLGADGRIWVDASVRHAPGTQPLSSATEGS